VWVPKYRFRVLQGPVGKEVYKCVMVFSQQLGCEVVELNVQPDHVHLLVTPSDRSGCALLMKHLAQRHSKRINAKQDRTGSLWEGRFHSGLVARDDYAIACYRYVELNPVRAHMVDHPSQYRWSSYNANVRAEPHSFVRPHPSFMALGLDEAHRTAAYRGLCDAPLQQPVIDEIRRATRNGHRMGDPRKPRGRPKRSDAEKNGDCHHLSGFLR